MGEDEKLKQTGRVLMQYQAAKVELAHLTERIRSVGKTYAEVAQFLQDENTKATPIRFIDGELCSVFNSTGETSIELLDDADLCKLLTDRDNAKQAVAILLAQLREFGVTSVE